MEKRAGFTAKGVKITTKNKKWKTDNRPGLLPLWHETAYASNELPAARSVSAQKKFPLNPLNYRDSIPKKRT